jgi:formylmethanofuran dehydrogenase subunit E
MKPGKCLHILRLLHFTDNNTEPEKTEENFDNIRKMRNLFEIIRKMFSKFYSPFEHLAVDEVIVLFKGRVIFRLHVPKEHRSFGTKICKTCDETVYSTV